MIVFDKHKIREVLGLGEIFSLLQEWGGDPEYSNFGILCSTICHNPPGEGSRKLYYYKNTQLFHCYTGGCENSTFDVFELTMKIAQIQWNKEIDLNEAVRWIATKFHIAGSLEDAPEDEGLDDWQYLANYARIQDIEIKQATITLKEYDSDILTRFNYNIKIAPWLDEDITQEVLDHAQIGFYPGGDQITIPHFDKDGRLIGIRGRSLCQEDSEKFGKYRPLKINGIWYNHPLGMNLYNLNNSKHNIALMKKAIIFEGEKSVLKYQSYFGIDNDISIACCGSNISLFQMTQLLELGVQEIVIAFDRQFQKIGDAEFIHLKNNLLKLRSKYKNSVLISFIFDKNIITGYKQSPIDEGPDKFLQLFKERIVL